MFHRSRGGGGRPHEGHAQPRELYSGHLWAGKKNVGWLRGFATLEKVSSPPSAARWRVRCWQRRDRFGLADANLQRRAAPWLLPPDVPRVSVHRAFLVPAIHRGRQQQRISPKKEGLLR